MTDAAAGPVSDGMIDLLIYNGIVLSMDDACPLIRRGYVAVTGDTISAVGSMDNQMDAAVGSMNDHTDAEAGSMDNQTVAEAALIRRARKAIDARGGIIMPGLVNAHTHAAMTLFRGLADDLPLMEWLQNHIFPAEARLDADKVRLGALLACAEMIRSGTTCFCDMYLFEGAVAEAADVAGMRAVVGEVLYDFPSPHYGPIENGLAYTEELARRWKGHPRVRIAVEPHSPYLCAPELLRKSADLAAAHDLPMVIHLSETKWEGQQIKERYGRTPVAHLDNLGLLEPNLLACHCVWLTDADIALLASHDVKVAHNPESNMKLASGVAPVPALLSAGVRVALGTDGCSSNNDLDMFAEMDTAAKLHKVHSLDPTALPAPVALRMATRDGAHALGLGHVAGALKPGLKADIIVIDTRKPHLTPMYNPESHLVYAVKSHDVAHSVIDGRVVMEDRRLTTIDLPDLLDRVRRTAAEIARRNGAEMNAPEKHSFEKHSFEKHSLEKHSLEKHKPEKHSLEKHSTGKHKPEKNTEERFN